MDVVDPRVVHEVGADVAAAVDDAQVAGRLLLACPEVDGVHVVRQAGLLEHFTLANVFATQVNVALVRAHCVRRDQAALDQQMRIVAHDIPVLAGAGLGFVSVDDEIVRTLLHHLRHEGPFQPGREAGAAAAS